MPYKRAGTDKWWIRVEGVRRSSGTTSYKDAKALESHLNAQAWRNDKLGVKAPKSFQDMCVRWARENSNKVSFDDDLRAIRWWDQFYGKVGDLREITRETTDAIIQKHRPVTDEPSAQNNTANHYVAYLAAMLNAACKKWDWIERAPLFRTYPKTDGRERWLTVEEWKRLEAVLPEHLRRPLTFALATGLRRGKVIGNGLQWSQVDLQNRSLTFKGHDNKRGNTIPLNDTAMAVLWDIRSKPHHLTAVFAFNRHGSLQPLVKGAQALQTALQAAGLVGVDGQEDACFHTLRHTWNSWLAQEGVDRSIRSRLGGWVDRKEAVDRYTHLSLDWLRPFAAVIDTKLSQGTDKRQATG